VTELILIRHGETDWNVEHRIQGHTDIPLNRAGLEQAAAIGERFRDLDADVLVSSDLRRAMQTMSPIASLQGKPVSADERLRERNLGILQGKTREEAQRLAPEAFEIFRSRAPDAPLEHGESLATFANRVIGVLLELAEQHEGRRIVAVTHGGVLDIAYRHAAAISLEAPRTFPIHNASINTFQVQDKQFRLVDWGDISHLPDQSVMDET
jgi:probable phosphoglycerate mutase